MNFWILVYFFLSDLIIILAHSREPEREGESEREAIEEEKLKGKRQMLCVKTDTSTSFSIASQREMFGSSQHGPFRGPVSL
jgi:hypothetical protein